MSKRQDTAGKQSPISPVLFMTLEGEPMQFFLRPGPTKQQLQPQIKAGGGLVTKVQEPGAILLADPEEFESLHQNVSHRYVSTQYIKDCVEKNEQLEVEDYRLNPEIQGPTTRQKARKHSSGGRLPYTSEEDAAILRYVAKHMDRIGGNQLWQEMGKKKVTGHSWQSMKAHYQKMLAPRNVSPEQKRTTEAETKPSESSQSGSEEMDVTSSVPQLELVPDDSSAAQSAPGSPTAQKKQAASPTPAQPVRRSLRRQLEIEELPLPQTSKRMTRSSLPPPSPQKPPESPPPSKKPKSADKLPPPKNTSTPQKEPSTDQPAVQNGTSTDQPSPRRDEGESEEMVADNCQASTSGQQAQGKKTEQRKLGILERLTKEFESSDDQTPDASANEDEGDRPNPPASGPTLQDRPNPAAPGPTLQDQPPEGPTLQEKSQPPEAACPVAVASDPPTSTSKAHLFIFDSESQDGRSQSAVDKDTGTSSCPQQSKKDAVVSLTQPQLEEDIRRIRALMKQTNQDLQSVTKALLRASGDFSVARSLLLTPSSVPGPLWNRPDDNFLRSGDPVVRERLQDKYGEEAVAKRLLFLEELRSLSKTLLKVSEDLAVAWSLLLTPSSVLGPFWSRWTCYDDSFLRSGDIVVRERLQDKFGEEAVAKRLLFLEVE